MDHFFRQAPLTTVCIGLNLLVFIAYHLGILPITMMVALPGSIGINTFLAHIAHIDMLHIAMNMVVFTQIGSILEQRLGSPTYGISLIAILLLTVFIGQPFLHDPTLGFSGILMGLIVLAAGVMSHYRGFSQQMLVLVGINLVTGLLPGISFLMHFVGAVAGGLVFALLYVTGQSR